MHHSTAPDDWDSLDLLAAFGQAASFMASHTPPALTLNQHESSLRFTCLWSYVVQRFSVLPAHIRTGQLPRAVATAWRAHGWFDQLPDKERHWLVRQLLIEVAAAWSFLSAWLKPTLPHAASILGQAAVAPQTAVLWPE